MLKKLIGWALFTLAACSTLMADKYETGVVKWNPSYKNLTCISTITLRVSSPTGRPPDLIIGLDNLSTRQDQVEVALGSVVPIQAQPPIDQVFGDISNRLQTTGPCTISLATDDSEKKRLAIHLRASEAQRVSVAINKQQPVSFAIGTGAVVYDGKVVMDSGKLHVLKLMALTYSPAFATQKSSTAELSRLATGKYFITPIGFRDHLILGKEMAFASKATGVHCCDLSSHVTIRISVAPTGQVVSTVPLQVSKENAGRLDRMMGSLKLKPFYANGTPVAADGYLSFQIEPSGRVIFFY